MRKKNKILEQYKQIIFDTIEEATQKRTLYISEQVEIIFDAT